jgi:hypothetical protein
MADNVSTLVTTTIPVAVVVDASVVVDGEMEEVMPTAVPVVVVVDAEREEFMPTSVAAPMLELPVVLTGPEDGPPHADAPTTVAYLPIEQAVQSDVPLSLAKLPTEHRLQPVLEFDSALNFPGVQATHSDKPPVSA